jgi:DNA-directed RNA polymerase subunit RPC12/RpoP
MSDEKKLNLKGLLRSGSAAMAPKEDAVAEPSKAPEKRCADCGSFIREKSEKEIDFGANGKKVGHFRFEEPAGKEISFAHIGGKKVGHRCQSCGSFVAEKSEKEDDARD